MDNTISRKALEIVTTAHNKISSKISSNVPRFNGDRNSFRKNLWLECINLCNGDDTLLKEVCRYFAVTKSTSTIADSKDIAKDSETI